MGKQQGTFVGEVSLGIAALSAFLWQQQLFTTRSSVIDGLLDGARKQAQPRRWPWQPKTARDYLNERGADLADLAAVQGDALLGIVRKQAAPRSWPWQPKTLRDLVNERSSDVAALSAEQSAILAAEIAKRRDALFAVAAQQAAPRRWPWQQKTIYDRVNARSLKLADIAAQRSADLADAAAKRRDVLVAAAQKQASPRRWPWQQKTAYDLTTERATRARNAANDAYDSLRDQAAQHIAVGTASAAEIATQAAERRDALVATARKQSKPRRWPWQQKTAYDIATERAANLKEAASTRASAARDTAAERAAAARDAASTHAANVKDAASATAAAAAERARQAVPAVQEAASNATDRIKELASQASASFQDRAGSASDNAHSFAAAVPAAVSATATAASDSLRDVADNIGKSLNSTVDSATSVARSAVHVPVHAVNTGVKAGKRGVRRSVRLFRTVLWALLIGAAVGVLAAPKAGKDTRVQLRDSVMNFIDKLLQAN